MNSDPKEELRTFQRSPWGEIEQEHLFTVPIHKEHWEWTTENYFWRPTISPDITQWVKDYKVHVKLGSATVERMRYDLKTSKSSMRKVNDPALHFLDVRDARFCHMKWGGCATQLRQTHIVTVGTLPLPGELILRKDRLKELKRLKKLIEHYGYNISSK